MRITSIISTLLLAALFISCQSRSPLTRMQQDLETYPEYSIILQDMKEEGNFFTDYFHRYKLVYGVKEGSADSLVYRTETTDWEKVTRSEYEANQDFLGMALVSKSMDSGSSKTPAPPGYQYVGDSRYGQWRQDNQGNSFWAFYGKFAFFSHMFGALSRPVYRSDYNDYRQNRSGGRPYYGRNKQFGTRGKYTQTTNKSFFERRKTRAAAQQSRFSRKFNNRRSSGSSMRRRSGGFGK